MLLVKTRLAPSPIHGIGLFAAERIKAGTPTWRFDPTCDRMYASAPPGVHPRFVEFATTYLSATRDGKFYVRGDNGRFANHAADPNQEWQGGSEVAVCDIAEGEELTLDYDRVREYDSSQLERN